MPYKIHEGWKIGEQALDVIMHEKEEVWLVGDLHFGYNTQRKEVEDFKRVLDESAKVGARIVFFGDMMEYDIPSHMTNKGVMWEQGLSPKQQREELTKILKPHKDRIVCLIAGNHEDRSYDRVEENPLDRIAEVLDVPFVPVSTWLRFIIYNDNGDEEIYTGYVIHGSGGSQNPEYNLRKEIEKKRMLGDFVAIAHIHRLYDKDYLCRYIDEEGRVSERIIYGFRTGGFLKDPRYAVKRSMEHPDCGYYRLWFDAGKHRLYYEKERI